MAGAIDEALDAVQSLLSQPLPSESPYPFPPGEDQATWCERCLQAFSALHQSSRLTLTDSQGTPMALLLGRLARGPMAESLEESPGRQRLLGSLVRTLHRPGRINQGLKGTCAVTCLESYMAERQPAEYARLCVGLMTPLGRVSLQNGGELIRDEDCLVWNAREARRGLVSRLFQVAAMEYAYPELDYRNLEDGHFRITPDKGAILENTGTGIDLEAFDNLLEGLTGERWDTLSEKQEQIARLLAKMGLDISRAPNLKDDALPIIRRSLAAGESLFATLDAKEPPNSPIHPFLLPHKVRVLGLDEARSQVIYEDPLDPEGAWLPGADSRVLDTEGRCSMPIQKFLRLMSELSYKPAFYEP